MVIVVDRSARGFPRKIARRVVGRYLFRISRDVFISGRDRILKTLLAELDAACRIEGVLLVISVGQGNAHLGLKISKFSEAGHKEVNTGEFQALLHRRNKVMQLIESEVDSMKMTGQPIDDKSW